MTRHEIIDVQLEALFGSRLPQKIQRLVDKELTEGRWVEGYDLAVGPGGISSEDARKLLAIVVEDNPELRIDADSLMQVVAKQLPQSLLADVSWIVDDAGSYALSDSLRVARFDGSSLVWRSPRISYDGIEFDSLTVGKLRGRAWLSGCRESPDAPFTFDFSTGKLLEGHIVEQG